MMKNKLLLGAIVALTIFPNIGYSQSSLATMNDWLERQLSSGDTSLASYFFLLIGGALASLLPCTYPLYPITVNILKSRSSISKKFIHPLFYFFGIVSMYFLFGIIASMSGGAFNTILRLPISNLVIAICIFLLGLSSVELLYIPLFSGASGDTKNKGVFGTYIMGIGAGLLSSACVGPVVVSILIGIAAQSTNITLALAFTAALKMLAFGIGLGIPFLLIGVFGLSLPKSGGWMKYIQWALGILIIYFSYVYLEKALLGYGFSDGASLSIALGSSAVIIASYFYQPMEQMPHQKMRKALLLLLGIIGFLILFISIAPKTVLTTTENLKEVTKTEMKNGLTWYLTKEEAYKKSKETGKMVFIDFHADWCSNCKEFQRIIKNNEEFNKSLQNVVLLKVYDTSPDFEIFKNDILYPELKVGLPFFIITDKIGNLIYKTNDFMKTDEMMLFLNN